MTLATCLRLLKHYEELKDDASQKASVRESARKYYDDMVKHLAQSRGYSPQAVKVETSTKAKKSA